MRCSLLLFCLSILIYHTSLASTVSEENNKEQSLLEGENDRFEDNFFLPKARNLHQKPSSPLPSEKIQKSSNVSSASIEESAQLENKETTKGSNTFAKVLFYILLFGCIGFLGSVFYYRYQMKKHRVVPFTPPSFCPTCFFPRASTHGNKALIDALALEASYYKPLEKNEFGAVC